MECRILFFYFLFFFYTLIYKHIRDEEIITLTSTIYFHFITLKLNTFTNIFLIRELEHLLLILIFSFHSSQIPSF
jgi:hypothetical protein